MSQIKGIKRKNDNNDENNSKKPKYDISSCRSRSECICCSGRHDNLKKRDKNSDLFIWTKINNRDEFTCHWCIENCNKRSIFCERNKCIYLFRFLINFNYNFSIFS